MLENIRRYFRYYLALLLAALLALGARVQAAPLRPAPCAVRGPGPRPPGKRAPQSAPRGPAAGQCNKTSGGRWSFFVRQRAPARAGHRRV